MYSNPVLWHRTILKQKHPTQSFQQDQYMHSRKKIFIILNPFNFLKGIERWPDKWGYGDFRFDNKTAKESINMKKRKTNPKREKTTPKKESDVRDSQQQCLQVPRPSIATCMVLSTYHITQETRYHPQYICENISTTKTWRLLYYFQMIFKENRPTYTSDRRLLIRHWKVPLV